MQLCYIQLVQHTLPYPIAIHILKCTNYIYMYNVMHVLACKHVVAMNGGIKTHCIST